MLCDLCFSQRNFHSARKVKRVFQRFYRVDLCLYPALLLPAHIKKDLSLGGIVTLTHKRLNNKEREKTKDSQHWGVAAELGTSLKVVNLTSVPRFYVQQ